MKAAGFNSRSAVSLLQSSIGNDNYTFEDMADVWRQFAGGGY